MRTRLYLHLTTTVAVHLVTRFLPLRHLSSSTCISNITWLMCGLLYFVEVALNYPSMSMMANLERKPRCAG